MCGMQWLRYMRSLYLIFIFLFLVSCTSYKTASYDDGIYYSGNNKNINNRIAVTGFSYVSIYQNELIYNPYYIYNIYNPYRPWYWNNFYWSYWWSPYHTYYWNHWNHHYYWNHWNHHYYWNPNSHLSLTNGRRGLSNNNVHFRNQAMRNNTNTLIRETQNVRPAQIRNVNEKSVQQRITPHKPSTTQRVVQPNRPLTTQRVVQPIKPTTQRAVQPTRPSTTQRAVQPTKSITNRGNSSNKKD